MATNGPVYALNLFDAEAFVWTDTSPFDNVLEVKQPVILVSPVAAFPGGEAAGGSVTETDRAL